MSFKIFQVNTFVHLIPFNDNSGEFLYSGKQFGVDKEFC